MTTGPKPTTWQELPALFWAGMSKPIEPNECWEWQGSIGGPGYGQMQARTIRRAPMTTHTLAYRLSFGPFPKRSTRGKRLEVMHTCDNRKCCRPAHLRLGTHLQNMRDAKAKGRLTIGGDWRKKFGAAA